MFHSSDPAAHIFSCIRVRHYRDKLPITTATTLFAALLFTMFSRIFRSSGMGKLCAVATSDFKRRKIADAEDKPTGRLPVTLKSGSLLETPSQLAITPIEPTESVLPLRPQVQTQNSSTTASAAPSTSTAFSESQESGAVEGRSRILPACCHGRGKAALTQDNEWAACATSNYDECHRGRIDPPEGEQAEYRLKTASPEHDLRWWLGDMGRDEKKADEYLHDDRFTEQHFRDAIIYAVAELPTIHQSLDSLLEYAERSPYNLRFPRIAEQANSDLLNVRLDNLASVACEDLQKWMVYLGTELQYMRNQCAKVEKAVTRKKFALAQQGNWSELEALWRLGYVDEVEKIARTYE